MIKLIAVDMDGTFLRDDKSYDEEKFRDRIILCVRMNSSLK